MKHGKASIDEVHIKLHGIDTKICGDAKPRKGVFWSQASGTAMTDYDKLTCKAHTMVSMTYEVLARRLRPRHFGELIGQEHVVRVLSHALDHGRLHHAYLFTGTRGVGKTTIARILAKCMNCEQGVSAEPCLECGNCVEIAEGRFPDLVEVDAASRTKIDQTRELLENLPYAPVRGRCKVYLIDEVHMLSTASFNALLKTLEEPPGHVRFLLATTDAKKIPVTVLSRCLQLQLKNLLQDRIAPYLEQVLTADGVEFDAQSIAALAHAGHGSMRDALSLTDQAISFCGGKLTGACVSSMLGTVHRESLDLLLEAITNHDAQRTLEVVSDLAELGADFAEALDQLSSVFHTAAVRQALADPGPSQQIRRLVAWDPAILQLAYQITIESARDLPLAPDPRCGFEMAMLRLLAFQPRGHGGPPPAQASEVTVEPPGRDAQSEASSSSQASAREESHPDVAVRVGDRETLPTPESGAEKPGLTLDWNATVDGLLAKPLVQQLARNTWFIECQGECLRLGIDSNYAPSVKNETVGQLADALEEVLGRRFDLKLDPTAQGGETPAQVDRRIAEGEAAIALASIKSDGFVQFLMRKFNASIDPGSIQLLTASRS